MGLANELRKHPSCDSAVGCIFLGGLYNNSPWPVGNKEEAKKLLGEAAKRAPKSRRNLYYCGVNAYQMEDYKTAQDWFQKALKAKCASPTEADFGQFMIDQSKRGLALSVAALKKYRSTSREMIYTHGMFVSSLEGGNRKKTSVFCLSLNVAPPLLPYVKNVIQKTMCMYTHPRDETSA